MKDPKKTAKPPADKAKDAKEPEKKPMKPFPEIYEPPIDYRKRPPVAAEAQAPRRLPPDRLLKPTRAMLLKVSEQERREEEQRALKLVSVKENLRDSQEFRNWQQREREAEEQRKLQDVLDTKLALERQREQMQEALRRRQADNQRLALEMQQASAAAKVQQQKEDHHRQQRVQSLKLKVRSITDNYLQAREDTLQQKKSQANALKADIERLLDERNNEEFERLRRRKEAVARIRAYEEDIRKSGSVKAYELFLARHKNMELMDVAELDEMYINLKKEFEAQIEAKRAHIRAAKERERERLDQLEKRHAQHQERRAKLAELQKQERLEQERVRNAEAAKAVALKEEQTLERLLAKKQAKAQADEATRELEAEINQKKLFFNQQKERYERIKNENTQLGKERVVSESQTGQLLGSISAQEVKINNLKNLEKLKTAEAQLAADRHAAFQRELSEATRLRKANDAADAEYKRSQNEKIRGLSRELSLKRIQ